MWKLILLLLVLIVLVLSVARWKWHPFIALLLAALAFGLCVGLGGPATVNLVAEGFSNTLKWIAIVVILGAFIGEVLRETGGAFRIAEKMVNWFGQKRLPWAMGLTGYLVSIPVFVDVAYIVLQPVTEALSARSKQPVLVLALALTAGLTVSHTLIPPTPGPLAVAALLDASIGRLLLINGTIGLFALTGGVIFAKVVAKNYWLAYDEKLVEVTKAPTAEPEPGTSPVFFDLLPILIPILLMGIGAFYPEDDPSIMGQTVRTLSTPMVAVLVGAGIAALFYRRNHPKGNLNVLVEQAITKSALVIMITGAGGAFGHLIREGGIQGTLTNFFSTAPFLGFFLPFLVAAVLTTATGSITVSLIGAASIVGPLAPTMPF
ncbi:MAG: GntP family permease, partial [Bacteroidota bacterium]